MITNQPKKIYLQVGDIDEPTDFQELYEVTWCEERINDNDIEYVRADLVGVAKILHRKFAFMVKKALNLKQTK